MKVALVHDYLVDARGAERIVEVFHSLKKMGCSIIPES